MKTIRFITLTTNLLLSVILLVFCLVDPEISQAVGGISNTKVIIPSALTVPKKHFQIHPFFGLEFVDNRNDTKRYQVGSRFTVGFLNNLEIGATLGYLNEEDVGLIDEESDFWDIATGLKFRLLDEGEDFPFSLAYQGGVTFPISGDGAQWVFEPGGLILTKNFTNKFSMDADFVVGLIEDDAFSFVSEIGFGYSLTPWFQPVIEASFALEAPYDEDNISILNITAGFTAPVTEKIAIIMGVTPDLYTENTDDKVLITFALNFQY